MFPTRRTEEELCCWSVVFWRFLCSETVLSCIKWDVFFLTFIYQGLWKSDNNHLSEWDDDYKYGQLELNCRFFTDCSDEEFSFMNRLQNKFRLFTERFNLYPTCSFKIYESMNELNKFFIPHLMRKDRVCTWLMFALTLSMTAQWRKVYFGSD